MKFALSLVLSCFLLLSLQIPESKNYVNDLTNTLTSQESVFLDQQLRSFEAMEGVQVVVIVVPTLEGQSIELTSQKIASQWQVGPKGHDSGILMLIAKQEGLSYIDLGYGMETNITDDMARQISTDIMNPILAKGRVYKGIIAGIEKIFADFGSTIGVGGAQSVGSFWDMTALIIFLVAIPILYFIARFADSKHIWISPALGFILGLTQSIGLAVALAALGGLMVLICYLLRTYVPPRK
ncbi:MAG: TPM domain-containing protein [Chlamydiales bacterium]|nr:TPM domain-containing protein [Chlamydiales bacterium]